MAKGATSSFAGSSVGARVGGGPKISVGGPEGARFSIGSINKAPIGGQKTSRYGRAMSSFQSKDTGPRVSLTSRTSRPDSGLAKRTEKGWTKSSPMPKGPSKPSFDQSPRMSPRVNAPVFDAQPKRPTAISTESTMRPKVDVQRGPDKRVTRPSWLDRPSRIEQPRVVPSRQHDTAPVRRVDTRPVSNPVVARVEQVNRSLAQEIKRAPVVATVAKVETKGPQVQPDKKDNLTRHPDRGYAYLGLMKKRLAKQQNIAASTPDTKTDTQVGRQTVSESVVVHDEEEKKKKKKRVWTFGESWRKIKTKLVEKVKTKKTMQQQMLTRQTQKQELTQPAIALQPQTEIQAKSEQQIVVQVQPEVKAAGQVQTATVSAVDVQTKEQKGVLQVQIAALPVPQNDEKKEEEYAVDQQTQKNRELVAEAGIAATIANSETDEISGEQVIVNFAKPSVPTTSGILLEKGVGEAVEAQEVVDPTDEYWRRDAAGFGAMKPRDFKSFVRRAIDSHRAVLRGAGKKASEQELLKVLGRKPAGSDSLR